MAVFRVEHTKDFTVMSNHHLKNKELSLKAKGLLSLMLSLPENWDYTMMGLTKICKDGISSIRTTIKELEDHGYLKRKRLRNEKGHLIDTEYTILEIPQIEPKCEKPISEDPTLENPILDNPMLENPLQLSTKESSIKEISTKESSTKLLNKNQSINPSNQRTTVNSEENVIPQVLNKEMIDLIEETIKHNISYEVLVHRFEKDRVDEIVNLLLEVFCSQQPTIVFGSTQYPTALVQKRMSEIDSSHIEYIFQCMDKTTHKIYNIKSYLLTSLYNAPLTISNYYQAEVNHSLYGQKS